MSSGPPRTARAAERAYLAIRERILSGEFPPGHRLVEDELAELTGVSRTPVREALNRLRADGLIVNETGRGSRVAGSSSEAELDELYGMRALLEGFGARLAAEKISLQELDALDALCARMEAELAGGRIDDVARLNNQLHAAVFRAAGNQRLLASLAAIVELPLVHRAMNRYRDHLPRSLADHREIVDALRAGDGNAAEALMRAHILSARAALRGQLDTDGDS